MTLFRLIVWRHLLHEPLRAIITVLGVGLGVAVYVAVATANIEVLRTFEEGVVAVAGRTTLQVTSTAALPGGFDETVIETIRQADGVTLATPVLEFSTVWRGGTSAPVTLLVLGVDLLSESRVRDYTIASAASTQGPVENPGAGEADWERYLEPDAIFIGRAFAIRYGVVTGVPIDLQVGPRVRRLTVTGILEGKGPAGAALEELAVMDIAAAQLMFDRLGRLDRIDVITDAGRPVDEIAVRIRERLPFGLLIKRPEQRNVQIERMTRAFRLNVASLSAVALLVGLFLVYNTMSFAVLRRRREIGILRSLGMLPYGIGRLFLLEGLLLGIVGWGVGILGGMVLARVAVGMMVTTSGDLYDIAVQHSQARVPMPVVAQSLLIGISVALLGSIGPIREASAVQPVRALAPRGYEVDAIKPVLPIFLKSTALFIVAGAAALAEPVRGLPIFGYLSAFLLIVAVATLSPVVIRAMGPCLRSILPKGYRGVVRIAADELERASVRNAVAVSALMVGLALMIGMGILIQSFRQTVDVWLDQTVKADMIVASPTWLSSGPGGLLSGSVGGQLEGISGVDAVDSYRDLRMEFRDRTIALVARDMLIHARHSRYLFLEGDSSAILTHAVDNDEVIISETFANQFGLTQGQLMTLASPRGPLEVRIAGVFYDYATDGGKIVMDRALFERFWEDRQVTVVPLYLAPGADVGRIRAEILSRLAGEPPVTLVTNVELKREVLRIFDQTFAVTYALEFIALLVALLAIVNALLSGILERQGELAVIRAIGGTPRQIGRIVLWESCLLGMAGILLGVAAGVLLSLLLIHVINKQSFGWSIVFHLSPVALLKAIGLVLITTVLAGYGPARRAAHLPMADSLRYE